MKLESIRYGAADMEQPMNPPRLERTPTKRQAGLNQRQQSGLINRKK
jgi:hypothetical protein